MSSSLDIIAVGAHMRGMPKNAEMAAVGAEFVAERRTAPVYRMFSIDDVKPALVRVNDAGVAFDVEQWRVPLANVGQFLRDSVSAPLGLADVLLEDGSTVKGFVGESYATHNALDVSHFGGWRHYKNSKTAAARERCPPLR